MGVENTTSILRNNMPNGIVKIKVLWSSGYMCDDTTQLLLSDGIKQNEKETKLSIAKGNSVNNNYQTVLLKHFFCRNLELPRYHLC
jgi:hypothetical protein